MLIFRNDDVCANTDWKKLENIYGFLQDTFPKCLIFSAVTIFSKSDSNECLYPDMPISNASNEYLYDVDSGYNGRGSGDIVISHGLFHVDHSKLSVDAQDMSILSSCNLLDTKTFVPPFGKYNKDTERICERAGIELHRNQEWKSLESENFDSSFKKWFFHSWNFTEDSFKELF